jgi:hypothetical protein
MHLQTERAEQLAGGGGVVGSVVVGVEQVARHFCIASLQPQVVPVEAQIALLTQL